jgi:ribose-phosphate pyrophosphokinase
MIDDIISYGGTLAYSADKLKGLCFEHIYAYATHTENSVLDPEKGTLLKRLENGTVDHIYTTRSTYSGKHDKITALVV